jgi:thiol-disulfide isomerase/thioredoxin
MKKLSIRLSTLIVLFNLLFLQTSAQSANESVIKLIRQRLGDKCLIRDENGELISFEFAAEQTIGASMIGKRIKYDPLKVVAGVNYEVTMSMVEASSVKPTFESINFQDKALKFYNQKEVEISPDEFKLLLKGNSAQIAAAYHAINGVVSAYSIIDKPKPMAIQLSSADNGASAQLINTILLTGKAMPDFKVTDISGNEWSLKDLKNRIIVLNFWFVECAPCIAEIPSLNKLVENYRSSNKVVFLSFANTSKDKMQKFLERKNFNYHHVAKEESIKYLNDWGISSYPQNVIIYKGKIMYSFTGGTTTENEFIFNSLKQEIDKVLQ